MPTSGPNDANSATSECPFCAIVAGEAPARVVSRRHGITAFLPDKPATSGHLLVVPDKHISHIWDLDQGLARTLMGELVRLASAVRDSEDPEGLNVIQSNGEVATQTVNHLHFHVLPRWAGDSVGPIWGTSPEWARSELDALTERIAHTVDSTHVPGYDLTSDADREDRRKHLDLVTGAIGRFAEASSTAKGWSVTLATAAFGLALIRDSWPLVVLGLIVLFAFGLLDNKYLENERRARNVYMAIADRNDVPPFSLSGLPGPRVTTRASLRTAPKRLATFGRELWASWSIRLFYGPLILGGLLLLVIALSRPADTPDRPHPRQVPVETR